MATSNALALCPGCGVELKSPKDLECWSCGRKLKAPENPYFAVPDYLHYQVRDQEEAIRKGPEDHQEREKKERELLDFYKLFFRRCHDEDRIAALSDAQGVLETLIISDIKDTETLKKITTIGKGIGRLAETIEKYAMAGGHFYGDELFKPPRPKDISENIESPSGAGAVAERE